MSLQNALDAAVAVFRRRPEQFLPAYLLTPAIPAIVRVVPFLGMAGAYLYLLSIGNVAALRSELEGIDLDPPPDADEQAVMEWIEGFEPIVELLFPPTVIAILLASILASAVVFFLLYAIVGAAQLAACRGRLGSERGSVAAIDGARRYWVSILGLAIFEFLAWVAVTVFVAVAIAVAVAVSPLFGALATLGLVLFWIAAVVVVRAVFAFAPVAVVVDDVGVLPALRGSVRFIIGRAGDAIGYYVLAIAGFVGIGVLAAILSPLGGAPLVAIVGFILVTPGLDLVKTAVYAEYVDAIDPPTVPDRRLRDQFVAGVRRGWRELWAFVRETPGLHALAAAVAIAGFFGGWNAAEPFVGIVETSIEARLEGHVPPAATVEFATNNWTVAVSTAYAGVAAGIPTLAALAFNGVVFGLYARLEVEPLELLAFVIPHGVIEIPAIVVAGALGFYLAVVTWRTVRGRTSREELADALERAFWVSIGVGILLVVAAAVEGFVSPYYAQFLL